MFKTVIFVHVSRDDLDFLLAYVVVFFMINDLRSELVVDIGGIVDHHIKLSCLNDNSEETKSFIPNFHS